METKVCKVFHKNPVKVLEFASTQLTQLTFLGDCMHQLAVKHWKQCIYAQFCLNFFYGNEINILAKDDAG